MAKKKKKRKNKPTVLSDADYAKYLMALKEEKPPKVIVNQKTDLYR
ncbi:MAG: hypothetical protein J6V68_03740 [Clostridia bacterium]|nr:hypothetical protein [Clostridia bacterium]